MSAILNSFWMISITSLSASLRQGVERTACMAWCKRHEGSHSQECKVELIGQVMTYWSLHSPSLSNKDWRDIPLKCLVIRNSCFTLLDRGRKGGRSKGSPRNSWISWPRCSERMKLCMLLRKNEAVHVAENESRIYIYIYIYIHSSRSTWSYVGLACSRQSQCRQWLYFCCVYNPAKLSV